MLLSAVSTSGTECRKSKTVVPSAQSVHDNTAAGGHIWQHVLGLTSRPKKAPKTETQDEKSLFASEDDFKNAWKKFQTKDFKNLKLQQCKGGKKSTISDCVQASSIGVTQAYRCTAIDKDTKLCTKHKKEKASFVEFWYKQHKGKWILNTAYPSVYSTNNPACKKIGKKSKSFEALLLKLLKFKK